MDDFDELLDSARTYAETDPQILEIRARSAAKCPTYDELVWDDLPTLFDQLCLLGMTMGWRPGLEVLIVSRYPPGVQTGGRLITLALPTVLNESVVVAHLRELQVAAAELAELHAVWLHILAPGKEHTMSYWHGTDPTTITHIALEA